MLTAIDKTTKDITSEMLIAELERQADYMKEHYPRFIEQQKLNPYERNQRESCNRQLLSIIRQLHMLEQMHGMSYMEILKHIQAK